MSQDLAALGFAGTATALRTPGEQAGRIPARRYPCTRILAIRHDNAVIADPEGTLADYPWRLDPETLREVIDDPTPLMAVRDALTDELAQARTDAARARLHGLRAVTSRVLRDLDAALDDGKRAVDHAEAAGGLRRVSISRARLAHVYQWRGDFAAADKLYALAASDDLPERLRAAIHQQTGSCCYEQGRYIEACWHFEQAIQLRPDADPEFMAAIELCLDAVLTRVALHGWGLYRRTRPELLGLPPEPVCHRDTRTGRWSYRDPNGNDVIGPLFDEAKPFSDGKAWVRRAGALGWEVIDQEGGTLLGPVRYRGTSPFGESLCWVRMGDEEDGWQVINIQGELLVPPNGYRDPHPFHHGLAIACQGTLFGAIDRYGEVAVPFDYDDIFTATVDGRYITGFTGEQLAVVERLGRRGVIDTTGRVIVPMAYADVRIHPIGFLVRLADAVYPHPSDGQAVPGEPDTWGVLDREGRPLIEPQYELRSEVLQALNGMLRDARPLL